MKLSSIALALGLIFCLRVRAAEPTPVLVELFTSEGCSSCPPADALLRQLAQAQPVDGVRLVPLELHVDYWDRLGWRDPFSSSQFTERQSDYQRAFGKDGVYTPQMVIQGQWGFVANAEQVRGTAAEARRRAPGGVTLELAPKGVDQLTFRVQAADASRAEPVELWVAFSEDGLVTHVTRGENAGRALPHAAVVRTLERVRELAGPELQSGVLRWDRSGKSLRAVAFLQERRTRRILKVAVLKD